MYLFAVSLFFLHLLDQLMILQFLQSHLGFPVILIFPYLQGRQSLLHYIQLILCLLQMLNSLKIVDNRSIRLIAPTVVDVLIKVRLSLGLIAIHILLWMNEWNEFIILQLQYRQMKKDYHEHLRLSQKIKVHEGFIQADGLMKKIRNMNSHEEHSNIDAEVKMREIMCFWKEGWEYDHAHHIFIEPRITRPLFFTKHNNQVHPKLQHYYHILFHFISKLKNQNEDETNYKIQLKFVQNTSESSMKEEEEEIQVSQMSFFHILKLIKKVSLRMVNNFTDTLQKIGQTMIDLQIDENRMKFAQFIVNVCENMQEGQQEQYQMNRSQIFQFLDLTTDILTAAKKQKMYSSVIAIQPFMGELTYIIHPLCLSIYSYFSSELLIKEALKERGKVYQDQWSKKLQLNRQVLQQQFKKDTLLHIQDDIQCQQQKHSKIVLINLDGYESQFNLEFVRGFNKNLMYISFPKFQNESISYNKRFYKKIMYNYTRQEANLLGLYEDNQNLCSLGQQQAFLDDPEKYHETIDELYTNNHETQHPQDINKNVYIFPIKFDELIGHQDVSQESKNIESYQSYFVRYLMRDQLYMAMRKFAPNTVMISYSGKVSLQNQHFLQMMQEIQKICSKVIFFPNFTAPLIEEKIVQDLNSYNVMANYDNIIKKIASGIISKDTLTELQSHFTQLNIQNCCDPSEIQLLDKLSIFLKVSSGYYNVMRPYQEEQFYKKYKNSHILNYIIHLYNALKNEYDHCKKKHSIDTIEASLAAIEQNVKEHAKDIEKCIPAFYKNIFSKIKSLLDEGTSDNEQHSYLVEEIKQKWKEEGQLGWRLKQWLSCEQIRISNMKYHEIIHLQLKLQSSRQEFNKIKDDKMDNLDNVFRITFSFKEHHQIVKIFQDVNLLYEINQHFQHKNHFYLILENIISHDEESILHFIAKPQINNRNFQRCKIIPLQFYNRNGLIQQASRYNIWTAWNYGETSHHLIMYWPQQFDYIAFYMQKMLGRHYEPQVLNHIFVSKKNIQLGQHSFYQIVAAEGMLEYLPRWGCSLLSIEDQIYIFGGFYHGEFNYLNDQNDITSIDLTDFNPQDFTPRKVFNLKKDLYCGQAFLGKIRQNKKVNSWVRPRMQFQFYDYDDLNLQNDDNIQEEDILKMIMLGGYGQNFKTPYSLFVNYYYLIKIERTTKRLLSIQKKYITERVVPINVRHMIKNRGTFVKNNILDIRQGNQKQQKRCREGFTNNYHYFAHRIVYAIKDGQLYSKVKNMFAIQLFEHSKKDLYNLCKKLGEIRMVQENEVINIKRIDNTNHQIMVEIGEMSYLYSLYYEVAKEQKMEEYPLTNKCIIAIDTKKYTIYALMSHSLNTRNQAILVTATLNLPEKSIIKSEDHYYLVLKELISFQETLNLHTLIICNLNEIAVLHGIGFDQTKAKEYLVKTKTKEKEQKSLSLMKKQTLNVITINPQTYSCIHSFFLKNNNLIFSLNFLQYDENPNVYDLICYNLDLQRFSQGWKQLSNFSQISFYYQQQLLRRISFDIKISFREDLNNLVIIFQSNRRAYYLNLSEITQEKNEFEVSLLSKAEDIQRMKIMSSLVKIMKSVQNYKDFQYFE